MANKTMSPSEGITAGQIGKLQELLGAALRKSGFRSEPVQQVLQGDGADKADHQEGHDAEDDDLQPEVRSAKGGRQARECAAADCTGVKSSSRNSSDSCEGV